MMTTPSADIADLFSKELDRTRSRGEHQNSSFLSFSKGRSPHKANLLNGIALLACVGMAIYYMKKTPITIGAKTALSKMKVAA
ncbi:MAG: hypothetical protein ABIQ95_16825 [Bdellovibrionia bacterium]